MHRQVTLNVKCLARAAALTVLCVATQPALAQLPGLIQREVLFGNPEKSGPDIRRFIELIESKRRS